MPSLATTRKIVFVASFLVVVTVITIAVEIYSKRQNLGLIGDSFSVHPPEWFAPINDPNKPDWEILPQEAKAGEVILSKRNELGILSNFAATPFELYGKRYASVEGFWQMMLYPEGPDDERGRDKRIGWKFTREQVAQMTAIAEARTLVRAIHSS